MSNKSGGYEPPETENFKFFSHRQCEYFPCHELKGNKSEEDFNCLFCYCPLYALGADCGGNYVYYKEVKDCSSCLIPHSRKAYDYIASRFNEIKKLAEERLPAELCDESADAVDTSEKV